MTKNCKIIKILKNVSKTNKYRIIVKQKNAKKYNLKKIKKIIKAHYKTRSISKN